MDLAVTRLQGVAPATARLSPPSSTGISSGSPLADRRGGVVAAILLAVLGGLIAAFLPIPVSAAPLAPQAAIYGVAEDNDIYSIDPATGQVTGTTSTASLSLVGSLANAFALDRDKSQIYFMGNSSVSGSNNLYYWDQPSNTLGQVATAAQLGVSQMQRNASFYNGRFWWIGIGDNQLNSATINYTSGLPSGITLESPISISGVTGPALNPNDIAINPGNQTLYGSDTITNNGGSGDFFSISLANLGGPVSYTKLYDQPTVLGTQVGVQLAFNNDYSTLYGQDYVSGTWYTVSTSNGGTFTATGGVTANPALRMRDLAGDVQAVPEPGNLALAGCGIACAAVMMWRGRKRSRGTSLPAVARSGSRRLAAAA